MWACNTGTACNAPPECFSVLQQQAATAGDIKSSYNDRRQCVPFVPPSQAGTYNVAGKKPPAGLKLHDWLDQWKDCWPNTQSANTPASAPASVGPDIVVIGFQEVVPLSAGNVIAGPSSAGADAWDYALASTLNGDEWWVILALEILVL